MAKKSKKDIVQQEEVVAPVSVQQITQTLVHNYMPYAMSVIISRAIPEIDGFKPSHRKLLYTMYKMGLLTGQRTKSANVVGQTMKLHPHGDAAIYETMVRLTRDNEALLHPFVDSKGSFGKQYSRDMAYAAPRYTEVKLEHFCNELFRGIDKDAVDFVPNYDNTMQEPLLLPTSFPNILLSPNMGIAVGMASTICSFNLNELCDGTIQLLKNPNTSVDRMMDIIKAPDFSTGASLIYNREQLKTIYQTGKGKFRLRARYIYDKDANCIDIIQIPYSTSLELIMKKLAELIKAGKLKEVSDFRDEIDLNGFKLTLDLKRGTDPDALMRKLYHCTPLEEDFSCNFNVLINGSPRLLGLVALLNEWIAFRMQCVKRELTFECKKLQDKLHLLIGLGRIILDIDKAIKIIRETSQEKDVIPNLMTGFSIDEVQAEYIAEIKLRNLNREYLLKRIEENKTIREEIDALTAIIEDPLKMRAHISEQLKEIKKKYGKPRATQLIYEEEAPYKEEVQVEEYRTKIFLTADGYFKKIKLQSLRGNDEHRLKDGDEIIFAEEANNTAELLFFTSLGQVYKSKLADFDAVKSSDLGVFVASALNFEENEQVLAVKSMESQKESSQFLFVFENGKAVRIPAESYVTKSNRKKLSNAFSVVSKPIAVLLIEDNPIDFLICSDTNRALCVNSNQVTFMNTRTSKGATVFQLKGKGKVNKVVFPIFSAETIKRYKKTNLPSAGLPFTQSDIKQEGITQ